MLIAFERAESEQGELEKRRLLNFVGPTGVKLAGAIAELARRVLAKNFRTIDLPCARIFLVEAGPRLSAPLTHRSGKKHRRLSMGLASKSGWATPPLRSSRREGRL